MTDKVLSGEGVTPTNPSGVELLPTQDDWNLANLCIPAAVIFAEEPEHVQDLRKRAAEHIAGHRLRTPASQPGDGTREVLQAIVDQTGVGAPGTSPLRSKWARYPSALYHRAVAALATQQPAARDVEGEGA